MKEKIEIVNRKPSIEEFVMLRKSAGWGIPEDKFIQKGIDNTVCWICAEVDGKIIGFARIVGDFSFTFLILDVVVLSEYRNQGVGTSIMENIMGYLHENASDGSYIALMSAKGKEPFYEKFGFWKRPNDEFGYGMMMFLDKSKASNSVIDSENILGGL
jgi:GNAT superfamily N-acetyltransferase